MQSINVTNLHAGILAIGMATGLSACGDSMPGDGSGGALDAATDAPDASDRTVAPSMRPPTPRRSCRIENAP